MNTLKRLFSKPLLTISVTILIAFLILLIWGYAAPNQVMINIANAIESASVFVIIIQAVLLFYQNKIVTGTLRTDESRKSKELAIKMAQYFESEILDRSSIVFRIYSIFNINNITEKIYRINMKNFDVEEMKSLIVKKDLEKLETIFKKNENTLVTLTLKENNSENQQTIMTVENKQDYSFLDMQYDLLNKLEYFCMSFNYNLADDEVVYQSLHQIFLDTVSLLYYAISSKNDRPYDKYYTNIIELFIKWRDRNETSKLELENKSREVQQKATFHGKKHDPISIKKD